VITYFAWGHTQHGFPLWERHKDLFGEPFGRYRTAEAYTIVVPRDPACRNPACRHLHRMAGLIPAPINHHAQGDVFEIADDRLDELQHVEFFGRPFMQDALPVVPVDGGPAVAATVFRATPQISWVKLGQTSYAELAEVFPRELAEYTQPKPCCVAHPGHAFPHDVLDPFDETKLEAAQFRASASNFAVSGVNIHMIEASAGVAPREDPLPFWVRNAVQDWRHEGSDDVTRLRARIVELIDQYTRDCNVSNSE